MIVPLAEVAPALPVAGYTVVSLGALIAFVVCWGLLHSWRQTFGRLLELLAAVGVDYDRAFVHIHLHPLRFLRNVDTSVQNHLSRAVAWSERAMVHSFTAAYSWATMVVTAPFHLGEATYGALQRAFHAISHTVPHTVFQTIVRPLDAKTRATLATLRATEATTAAKLSALTAHVAHLEHAVGVSAHTATTAVAELPARVGITSKQLRRLLRRTSALERATVGLGAVALVATALGRMNLGWLRCPALGRIGRKVGCGGFHFLELLLAETLDVLLIRDLCAIVKAIERIAIAFEDDLLRLVNEIEGFICGGEAVVPSAIVRADLKAVAKRPSAITAYDLQPPIARKIAA